MFGLHPRLTSLPFTQITRTGGSLVCAQNTHQGIIRFLHSLDSSNYKLGYHSLTCSLTHYTFLPLSFQVCPRGFLFQQGPKMLSLGIYYRPSSIIVIDMPDIESYKHHLSTEWSVHPTGQHMCIHILRHFFSLISCFIQ